MGSNSSTCYCCEDDNESDRSFTQIMDHIQRRNLVEHQNVALYSGFTKDLAKHDGGQLRSPSQQIIDRNNKRKQKLREALMSADKGRNAAGIIKKREYDRGSHQKDSTHTTMEFETENSLEHKVKN